MNSNNNYYLLLFLYKLTIDLTVEIMSANGLTREDQTVPNVKSVNIATTVDCARLYSVG